MRSGWKRWWTVVAAFAAAPALAASTVQLPSYSPTNPDQKNGTLTDVVVPVTVTPADGVTSIDLQFSYSSSVLTPTGVYKTGYTSSFSLTSNISVPGTVQAHLSGGGALSGSGEVVWAVFRVIGGVGATSSLTWVSAVLNGGAIPAVTQNGNVRVSSGTVTVSVPDTAQNPPSTTVTVPISATAFTGSQAFDLTVKFNPAVITAASVQKTTLTDPFTLVSNLAVPGVIAVVLYGTASVSGSGALLDITFNVLGPIGARTPLNLTKGNLNEGNIANVLDDGLFTVCDGADGDGDMFTGCGGDCNNANPAIHPGASEICDGQDNNCDGTFEGATAPAGIPMLFLTPQLGGPRLSWTSVPGATQYDIVRGSLPTLRSSGGNFTLATQLCLANDTATNSIVDPATPAVGSGFWYLLRPASCRGNGTYDSGTLSQVGLRDAEIQAFPAHCP